MITTLLAVGGLLIAPLPGVLRADPPSALRACRMEYHGPAPTKPFALEFGRHISTFTERFANGSAQEVIRYNGRVGNDLHFLVYTTASQRGNRPVDMDRIIIPIRPGKPAQVGQLTRLKFVVEFPEIGLPILRVISHAGSYLRDC
jgi:hypothetical protein